MIEKRGFNRQEAMTYLGIKRKAFDTHIRPRVPAVRIGSCLVFERFDLDRAFEEYKAERNGRPGEKGGKEWADQWQESSQPETVAGSSTRSTNASAFRAAASRLTKKRQRG